MTEHLYTPLPDQAAYLARINHPRPEKRDVDTLNSLLLAQLMSVPFENIDIYDFDRDINLGIEDLFDKQVIRRRGGYCFENNALFMSLCQSLGYECYPLIGRIVWQRDFYPQPGHRANVVVVGGERYLCDVGYGGVSPCMALNMDTGEIQHTIGGEFSFAPHEKGIALLRHTEEYSGPLMIFDERPADPVDYIPLNFFYSKSPTSFFRMKRMVNIKTANGNKAIDGDTLRIRDNGDIHEEELPTAEARAAALEEHFGIDLRRTVLLAGE